MTNNKGITLIALVITLIVLLILAGVSIAMLTGQNGILTQANTAKTDTANAEAAERINVELNALYSAVLADSTKATFTDTENTGDVAKTKANLPSDYKVKLDTDKTTITISNANETKSGSITITKAGTATLSPATK